MRLIKQMLRMRAVYWAPTGDTDEFGNKVFGTPVVIKCRWEERVQEFAGPNDEKLLSNAIVYTGRDVELLGVLKKLEKVNGTWQGLSSLASTTNPFANDKAWEVRRFDKLPTIKATEFVRQAYL